jgi:Fe-S-cluster-containing dehydrogenase component
MDNHPRTIGSYLPQPTPRWGMVIDLNLCTGCSACVVACRAENNLPIVGAKEAADNGSFQWIRIERDWGTVPRGVSPDIVGRPQMPVLCQQCDAAPCEPVCPVFATYHNDEGLNVQVYNRCVGTRYCANNCPYNVRFFNWFDPQWPTPMEVQLNPEVSRRTRGVMEKCTFCIQRIAAAERTAEKENRRLRDGEAEPACAQTCPTQAILFGNLSDPESRASEAYRTPDGDHLLGELGTETRIKYIPRETERLHA